MAIAKEQKPGNFKRLCDHLKTSIIDKIVERTSSEKKSDQKEMNSAQKLYNEETGLANAMCQKALTSPHPIYAGRMTETREVPKTLIQTVQNLIASFNRICGKCDKHVWFIGGD